MTGFFDVIRNKPLAIRRRYTIVISLGLIAVIGGVWLMSFSANLKSHTTAVSDNKQSPFRALVQNFKQGYSDIKNNISESNPFSDENKNLAAVSTASTTMSTSTEATPAFGQVIIVDPEE